MKNKNLILETIVILIVIFCGIGGGYLVYKHNIKTNDTTNKNEENKDKVDGKDYDKRIAIEEIDMSRNLKRGIYTFSELDKLEESNEKINIGDINEDDPIVTWVIHVMYNNGTFSYVNDKGEKKEYNNVKSVYTHEYQCSSRKYFYLLFDNKVIVLEYIYGGGFNDNEEYYERSSKKIINTKVSYDAIYSIYISVATCDAIYDYAGYVEETDKYYDLYTGKEIDREIQYTFYDTLTTDRKLKIDNYNLNVKIAIPQMVEEGFIGYVIDEDGYLYGYKEGIFKKLFDKRIKYLYYSESDYYFLRDNYNMHYVGLYNVYVQFEDKSIENLDAFELYM